MLICVLEIYFLLQLLNVVQCINDNEITTEIDGTEDKVDLPKNKSIYRIYKIDLKDYHDYLVEQVEKKQVDPDYVKLQTVLRDISYIQNFWNEAEPPKDTAVDTATIDIESMLKEVGFVKYQPAETAAVGIQSSLNGVEFNGKTSAESVAKDYQVLSLDEEFKNYQPTETVAVDIKSSLNEDEFNGNTSAESVAEDYQVLSLDEEFNKYQPAKTVTIDMQSSILNDNEDPYVERATIVWQNDTSYNSSYRKTVGLIGVIIMLILGPPYIIYKLCYGKKELKLRVFVIKSKPAEKEPLVRV